MLTRVNMIHPKQAGYCLKQLSMVPDIEPSPRQISDLRKVAHRLARGWKQTDIIRMPAGESG
jgi:hypothetical protein